jgi:hypothetical protein
VSLLKLGAGPITNPDPTHGIFNQSFTHTTPGRTWPTIGEGRTPVGPTRSPLPSSHVVGTENRYYHSHNGHLHGRYAKLHEVGYKSSGVADASGLHKLGYLNIYDYGCEKETP